MFNLENILKTLNSFNINSHKYGPTIYQKNNELGICLDIKDTVFGFLTRKFIFDNNKSLEDFLKKYSWYKQNAQEYNIELTLDKYDTENPNIQYTYNNKELTLEEMLNFKNLKIEKEEKLINDESKNIYLTNIRELTNYLIDLKKKNYQNKVDKNNLKIKENDLKFELIEALSKYYGQNKKLDKKAVSLESLIPNNDINLLETNLKNINTKSLDEIKTYLKSLIDITKNEELNDKNLINTYSISIYKYNIEILNKQILFVKNKITSEKNFNAKGSKIHNIDEELKSFLKNNVAPIKIEVYIAQNQKIINDKYEQIKDIKDAYSIISGNKLAFASINMPTTFNKDNVIKDLTNKFYNLDKKIQAHLVLYNSFYKNICNYIINNNYNLDNIKNEYNIEEYFKELEDIAYNENNSHYLINYFNFINFKTLSDFTNSLVSICKTVTSTEFNPLSDLKAFGKNDNNIIKKLNINPVYNNIDEAFLVTLTPINKILFIPECLEIDDDTKEINKITTNSLYIKSNITKTNNIITVNKYNKENKSYNNSDIIITTNLTLKSSTTFIIGNIEGEII